MAKPVVAPFVHRALGKMLRMTLAPDLNFDLTPEEASTLARALRAVTLDPEITDTLYLSPLASDDEFSAKVTRDGLEVTTASGICILSWPDVVSLAEQLAPDNIH